MSSSSGGARWFVAATAAGHARSQRIANNGSVFRLSAQEAIQPDNASTTTAKAWSGTEFNSRRTLAASLNAADRSSAPVAAGLPTSAGC